jgi:hypothetical protein|nr:MAG TPA: hypothetical protein [Caudoviricetes sp.]
MARNNSKNAENKENLENQEQANENLEQAQENNENLENQEQANENLEQAEETKEQPKSNADSLAVEAKGFSESAEFKVNSTITSGEVVDGNQTIIRF